MIFSGAMAGLCYLLATVFQLRKMLNGVANDKAVMLLGSAAILLHGVTAYQGFYDEGGYNLGLYPMLSLMLLSIAAIVLISGFRRPVDNLFVIIFPAAIVTIIMEISLTGDYAPRADITDGIFSHIVLSVVAYSLLTIAAVQALLLSLGDNLLRHHQLLVLRNLPPLETMEHLMFEMIWIGLGFLTLSIASGFLFVDDFSGPGLVHHTVITLAAWVVFMVLAWGRYQLGWRGAVASRWTLSGFVLLALGYFGSKLVLEIILGKA